MNNYTDVEFDGVFGHLDLDRPLQTAPSAGWPLVSTPNSGSILQ